MCVCHAEELGPKTLAGFITTVLIGRYIDLLIYFLFSPLPTEKMKEKKMSVDTFDLSLSGFDTLPPLPNTVNCIPELTALTSLSLAFSLNKGLMKNSANL